MTAEHGQQGHVAGQIDDPESGWTWFLMLVSFVLLTVTVVAVTVIFFAFQEVEVQAKVIDRPALELTELRGSQEAMLQGYHSYQVIPMGGTEADAETRIRIPIERAMELMVAGSRSPQAQADGDTSMMLLADQQESNTP
ncbi:MAG: hypothetical protein CBC35_04500 [Planctomycetes bacterium TMED75]|nr:hypothetical protein [Planctomycetaceae bacterium]OUU94125.1 MAG: hypothetical protein CBC35_04500 [Planctomycetes bacterium TMED75]